MMGVCFDCLVTIDGVGNRQGCLVPVREGMRVETQTGQAARPDDDATSVADLREQPTTLVVDRRGARRALPPAALGRRAPACRPLLLDENPGPGGQIYRAHHVHARAAIARSSARTTGRARRSSARPGRAAPRSSTAPRCGASTRRCEIGVSIARQARLIQARRVILATGALERPFPIPGWTLPGVMTAGAAQTVLKSSGLVPDGRTVMAGQRAAALAARGADPARRRHASTRSSTPRRARNWLRARCRICPTSCCSPYLAKGLALLREVQAKVPVVAASTALAAAGDGQARARSCSRRRGEQRMPADLLLLHQGVVPNVNLAIAAGVRASLGRAPALLRARARRGLRQLACRASPSPATAPASRGAHGGGRARPHRRASRRCAALEARRDALRRCADAAPARSRARRCGRAFLDALFQPAPAVPHARRATRIVCRCEEVTAKQIRDTVAHRLRRARTR